MDKQLCKLFGESSRDFSRNIDPHAKQNIELLANLAVMELQFVHGCALDWRASSGGAAVSTCASDSRILNAGENGDDDNSDDDNGASGEEGSDEGAGGEEGSSEGNHGE
jgi:hypothetical protein